MKSWHNTLIKQNATLRDAIAAIDGGGKQIALMIDRQGRLIGTITDGDIRRAILRGLDLDSPAAEVIYRDPTVARAGDGAEVMLARMRSKRLHQIPIVDDAGRVVGIEALDDLVERPKQDSWVVLMAGGLGTRLSPLTDDTPKPLLSVGNKPILETIVDGLISHGFQRIFIAVNYRAAMVKERFGNGADRGIAIEYLEEDKRLGTAGALSLLPETPSEPFLVMNGDLLTNLNYRHLLAYHYEHGGRATVCVREEATQIPYGVVEVQENRVVAFEEKPVQRHYINAGIYVLNPDVLPLVPRDGYFDMTSLIEAMMQAEEPISVFPIREFWMDIGQHADYEAAHAHYAKLFE